MAIYRITRFTSSDMAKAIAMAEEARDEVAAVGAAFIDIAADDDGNGVVVAKYPDALLSTRVGTISYTVARPSARHFRGRPRKILICLGSSGRGLR